jgi:hypothetical protein
MKFVGAPSEKRPYGMDIFLYICSTASRLYDIDSRDTVSVRSKIRIKINLLNGYDQLFYNHWIKSLSGARLSVPNFVCLKLYLYLFLKAMDWKVINCIANRSAAQRQLKAAPEKKIMRLRWILCCCRMRNRITIDGSGPGSLKWCGSIAASDRQ